MTAPFPGMRVRFLEVEAEPRLTGVTGTVKDRPWFPLPDDWCVVEMDRAVDGFMGRDAIARPGELEPYVAPGGYSVACPCLVGSVLDWCDPPGGNPLEHFVAEHDYDCGGWTFDPPCGGCTQCIIAQAFYYVTGRPGL